MRQNVGNLAPQDLVKRDIHTPQDKLQFNSSDHHRVFIIIRRGPYNSQIRDARQRFVSVLPCSEDFNSNILTRFGTSNMPRVGSSHASGRDQRASVFYHESIQLVRKSDSWTEKCQKTRRAD
jgi:hypothetical protein